MAITCSDCGQETARYRIRFSAAGAKLVRCSVCENPKHAAISCANPYGNLTLAHAHDDQGKPIHVTSLRQLRAAEQRYHFRSVVANEDAKNFDTPPKQHSGDLMQRMTDEGKWLYPEVAESMLAEMREAGELGGAA